eukprot:gene90-694_t
MNFDAILDYCPIFIYKLLLRLIHFGLTTLNTIQCLTLYLWRYYVSITGLRPSIKSLVDDSQTLEKVPKHMGILLSDRKDVAIDDIVNLVTWAISFGVHYVSLYEKEGELLSYQDVMQQKISCKLKKLLGESYNSYSLVLKDSSKTYDNGYIQTKGICVQVLSEKDGKEDIVNAAKKIISLVSNKEIAIKDINPALVNDNLKATKGLPDPDLAIQFGEVVCLNGFLPWQSRLTEFISLTNCKNIQYPEFFRAMKLYGPIDDNDGSKNYFRKSKKERWDIIKLSEDVEKRCECAAIEIQRCWRGYLTRSTLFAMLHANKSMSAFLGSQITKNLPSISTFTNKTSQLSNDNSAENLISSTQRDSYQKDIASLKQDISTQVLPKKDTPPPYTSFLLSLVLLVAEGLKIICVIKTCSNAETSPAYGVHAKASFKDFCATTIQRWWKSKRYRMQQQQQNSQSVYDDIPSTRSSFVDTVTDKSEIRVSLMKSPSHVVITTESKAATVIQRAWRKHIDLQVYKYYQNLINFKLEGDPAMMLRCINPAESNLLDSAAGVHVRFRLGGEQFPPSIYYKIFTRRNIADIGAFAPRNYTKADYKALPMKYVHNKGTSLKSQPAPHDGWYERYENNGWRPVSDKLLQHVYKDPISYSTSQKKQKFHHSKLVRREDLARRQKARKIEWMKKMYREGALKANDEDPNIQSLIQSAAERVTNTDCSNATQQLHEKIDDWEVDELLHWTNGLNFDKYNADWKELGTTM